jgi:CBS-domain-containing membrane protein
MTSTLLGKIREHIFFFSLPPPSLSLSLSAIPNNLIRVSRANFNCRIIPIALNAIISAQVARIAEKEMKQQRKGGEKKTAAQTVPDVEGGAGRGGNRAA